jgi:DNA excision repair protein ERCC-2
MGDDASNKNTGISFDVSVRDLVEFVLRRGDLRSGPFFTSPSRALEGTRGHQKLQSSRPDHYQAEVSLKWVTIRPTFTLTLRGRIDGVKEEPGEIVLEEIKTVTGEWSQKPSDLHWAQLRIYGGIWNRLNPSRPLHLRLTYFHLETDVEHCFDEKKDPASVEVFLENVLGQYLNWLEQHVARTIQRNVAIQNLAFPFSKLRVGQESMLETVANLHLKGGATMVEAPTGIGKTMASLLPSIKALTGEQVRQVMIVLARTPGQTVFQEALKLLEQNGAKIKTLSIIARDKVCLQGTKACDPANCPKRLGHFDRLTEARHAAIHEAPDLLDTSALIELGDRFNLCPHALATQLAPWVDVVMGDYNYAFDPGAQLNYLFGEEAPRRNKTALLVDESHNLVDRGREMHSQCIRTETWTPTVKWLQKNEPRGATLLRELWKAMMAAFKTETGKGVTPQPLVHQTELFPKQTQTAPPKLSNESLKINKRVSPYEVIFDEIPESWILIMDQFLQASEEKLKTASSSKVHKGLLELYFEIHGFLKASRAAGKNHRIILKRKNRHVTLHRFCMDPSRELSASWKKAWSTLFFSATLSPAAFYRQLIGLNERHSSLSLPSPFQKSQWQIIIHQGISTTYRQRAYTYSDVAQVIRLTSQSKQGNYLTFFPSYEYLRQVMEQLTNLPELPESKTILLAQTPEMDESTRSEFLSAFKKQDGKTRIGLAVMGGIFGEGIDLIGKALIGVIVVGVGLPQVCLERDLIREHFDANGGDGFDFAYRHPGINRVMQAVGRLIRSEKDRGVAVLIDQRYRDKSYFHLLPNEWPIECIEHTEKLEPTIKRFWNSQG